MRDIDTVTWTLLLCCTIAGSASGWMLYYIIYEGSANEVNIATLSLPVVGIGMSITIMVLNEKYRRKQIRIGHV